MKPYILRNICIGFMLWCLGAYVSAQTATTYPVQVYTQLIPPYTPFAPAYYSGGVEKLRVTLINTDMQQPLLNVFLRMKITSSTFSMQTPDWVRLPVITLQAGVPTVLSISDLEPFFRRENLSISGGQSQFYQTLMFPDNFYRFSFEACDENTGRLLSNTRTGFAMAMIAAGDPPRLNLQLKGSVVQESNIPNIMFTWTPRHLNSVASAYGTEYEISLVEIYDKQTAPENAFQYSRVLFTERTRSTSFIYNSAYPFLQPGLRYAWRVQAIAQEWMEDAQVFKNNGYSEIFWFDYKGNCSAAVMSSGVVTQGMEAKVSWQPTSAFDYSLDYRKKGGSKWYAGNVSGTSCPLYNLQPGETYEYRIGSRCYPNDVFDYTAVKGFTMPDSPEKSPNCGMMPDVNLANRELLPVLQPGLPVFAGDFPIFTTEVRGSNGHFSGTGYVGIPFTKLPRITVTFDNITVNNDYRLIGGYFETKYDIKNNNLLWDIDQTLTGGKGVGDIRTGEERARFIVDYTINPDFKAIPVKPDGTRDEIPEGGDYTFATGENGKYTFLLIDSEGNEHKVESDTMPVTVQDKSGKIYQIDEKGNVTLISSNSNIRLDPATCYKVGTTVVSVEFAAIEGVTRYAVDQYKDAYKQVTEYYEQYKAGDKEIAASAKFMLPGTSDKFAAKIKGTPEAGFDPDKVHFVTMAGKEYERTYIPDSLRWEITVVASDAGDGQELFMVYETAPGKYATVALINAYTYEPLNRSVTLVPVNNAMNGLNGQSVEDGLNRIYGKIGVHWTVSVLDAEFNFTPKNGSTFNVTGSGLFSMLTDDMKAINEAFKQSGRYQEDGLYLFVLPYEASDKSETAGTNGDMPLSSQFGYLFPGVKAGDRTIAHEVGHVAFNLEHPFDRPLRNSFPKGVLTDNLMDYGSGTGFAKIQWDQTRAPGLVIGLFQTDKSGMGQSDDVFKLEINKRLIDIGKKLGEKEYLILYSTICSSNGVDSENINIPNNQEVSFNLNGVSHKGIVSEFEFDKRLVILLGIDIEEMQVKFGVTKNSKLIPVEIKENSTFFGVITNNNIYNCDPPEDLTCDLAQKHPDIFYSSMFSSILNCLENENGSKGKIGDKLRIWILAKNPNINVSTLNEIADNYNKIADILFEGQTAGNEWEQYGEFFKASFDAALKANNIDNGDYLKRLNEFIKIFEGKLDQLNRMEGDKIALFVGTFSDTELEYLPMSLRIQTMDMLSKGPELMNLLNPVRRAETSVNWAMKENMILKLLEMIEQGEEGKLLENLKTSNTIKKINNNLDDFITLVDDNYTKFLDLIDNYVYYVNTINENTRGSWLQKLYDNDKTFNISKITKEGEPFISATRINEKAEVELQLKEFNGQYETQTFDNYDGPYTTYTPLYDTRNINISYDEPIAIYHNAYLSGVSTDRLGEMQIASALRAHYYLQKHKDEVTATAIWTTIDVATLFVGVGEISAAVKAASKWRLVLGVCNTASSAGSLLATGLDSYLINQYGKDGEEFLNSLRKVSAVLGFADLGAAGIRKFGNMLDDDLITIGRFNERNGTKMLNDSRTKELEQTTQKLVANFDDDLKNAIKIASQNSDDLLATLKASYPKLYERIAYVQESLRKDFLTDFADNTAALSKFENNTKLIDAWQTLNLAKRRDLRKDIETIESLSQLMQNERLAKLGVTSNNFGDMLKAGWGGEPQIPSFKKFCDEVNQLLNDLPPENTADLSKYLGSSGFTNASGNTQRHSYVQLQRLLENENVLKNAQSVKFENEISQSAFGIGTSVSDVHIVSNTGTIIEIETKAGMEFFEGLGSSNFTTQSGNSLMTVSKIEDYKVFLNPERAKSLTNADKLKVIDAWKNQPWFKDSRIQNKFKQYGQSKGFDFTDYTIEDFLRSNNDWFDDIFINNIKQ